MKEINKRVRLKRNARLFSQRSLAEALGIRESTYSQMERMGKIPVETLVKISEILDVDIRYFIYGENFLEKENEEKATKTEAKPEHTEPLQKQEEIKNAVSDTETLLDEDERYLILTYRNLNSANKRLAYDMFMEHFNINVIIKKRREERLKKMQSKS